MLWGKSFPTARHASGDQPSLLCTLCVKYLYSRDIDRSRLLNEHTHQSPVNRKRLQSLTQPAESYTHTRRPN